MIKHRADRAIQLLDKHGLTAMLFTDMANVRYLTGFTGTDGVLVVTGKEVAFLTDSRYITQAEQQTDCRVVEYSQKIPGIAEYLQAELITGDCGYESTHLTCSTFADLQAKLPKSVELCAVNDSSLIRSVKDDDEICRMQTAAAISFRALESILPLIRPGVSEREVALELEIAARRFGSEVKAFDFIVASGERGAMPHGVASDKVVENGEVVTIDFGSCSGGYFSDETVNFAVGSVPDELRKIHDIVLEAHDLAINSIKPGIFLSEIDRIARDFISEKGYGTFFGHGLGHGVGLEIHEHPRVSPQSQACAEVGMVFTVEPGIYVPGLGGVRIEDMVVVTESGCRCLTGLPKELRQL